MSIADKLKQWAKEPLSRAVEHLTIDEIDDLAIWAMRELQPTAHFGMTRAQRELDAANLRVGAAHSEIRMLKAALNNRDSEIRRLKK
jgi:hypothetical protein